MTSQSFLAAIFAMFAASAAASEPEIIRIGLVRADHAPGCYGAASLEDEAAVYAQHLESRFSSAVELCFSSDGTWEAGEPLDLAWGAREMLASLEDGFRPILTARRADGLGRVPMVFFTVSDHSGRSMADIGQNSLATLEQPRRLDNHPFAKMVFHANADVMVQLVERQHIVARHVDQILADERLLNRLREDRVPL